MSLSQCRACGQRLHPVHSLRHALVPPLVPFSSSSSSSRPRRALRYSGASRRNMLAAVAGLDLGTGLLAGLLTGAVTAAAARAMSPNPDSLIRSGMNKFRQNDVAGSLEDFDQVLQLEPRMRPYLWQRGLTLYYLQQYTEGAQQFRDDVAVNPNDTEESIWAFLCEAQLEGAEAARTKMLKVGRDPRPVMRAAYECFRSGADPSAILAAASDAGGHDSFYANLYVGLWHEAHAQPEAAKAALLAAVATPYALTSNDYMAALAKIHCLQRSWSA